MTLRTQLGNCEDVGSINRKNDGKRNCWCGGSGEGKVSVRWLADSPSGNRNVALEPICILSRQKVFGNI